MGVKVYKWGGQRPPFEDFYMTKRTYRYFAGEPLYPFGYGLAYTSLTYSDVKVDHEEVGPEDAVTVSVKVANSGRMAGDEVVQLYLTHPGIAGAPIQALAGFQRVHLDRGDHKTVSFLLRDRDLSIVNESGQRRIVPGSVDVWIGGGQPTASSATVEPAGSQ